MENSTTYNNYKKTLLLRAKNEIRRFAPQANIFLFGSRARDDFNEDSDWDLLIIFPNKIESKRKSAVLRALLDIELSENIIFNPVFFEQNDWNNNKIILGSPFYENVVKEAIAI